MGLLIQPGLDESILLSHPQVQWTISTFAHELLTDPYLLQNHFTKKQLTNFKSTTGDQARHARLVYTILGTIAAAALLLWLLNGTIIHMVAALIPPSIEQDLGQDLLLELKGEYPKLAELKSDERIARIGQRLVRAMPGNQVKFHFYLIEDPEMNAFAIPGGHIVVLTGLLSVAKSDDELASVLAHEIAHITERHAMQRTVEEMGFMMGAKLLLGGHKGFATSIAKISLFMGELKYSRQHELQADQIGLECLARAKMQPQAMIDLMKTFSKIDRGNISFFSTHPATSERIAALEESIKKLPR